MDKKKIEEVIKIAEAWDLEELEIEEKQTRIRVVRRKTQPAVPAAMASAGPPPGQTAAPEPRADAEASPEEIPEGLHAVLSPMVGIFLAAADAAGPAVPAVGDAVVAGQVLGFVEAMKMQTQIVADCDGELVEVLASDQQAVQFNEPIFLIRPRKE